jgi:hypothetical protein
VTAGRGVEISESLDDVDTADVASETVDDLAYILSGEVMLLEETTELTPAEKVELIRSLREQIRNIHETIVTTRAEVRNAFEALRVDVQAFHDAGLSLSEEQRTRVGELRTELKDINDSLRDSIGMVYDQMRALRGHYDLAHVDLILSTHQDVLAVLQGRLANLERINAIFAELASMVAISEE